MEYEIIGAIKIKDGLFLGDECAAQDLEFVVTNKVSRIINCSGKQIPNHWDTVGVKYLTYMWLDNDKQIIFDHKDEVLMTTYKFIEEGILGGDSILVHSVRGHNRSICIIAAYLMRKYRWTFYKTLEFLQSRRPDLEIRPNFFNQLLAIENRLAKIGYGAKSSNWRDLPDNVDSEEILLTNTYLNTVNLLIDGEQYMGQNAPPQEKSSAKQNSSNNNISATSNTKIKWIDAVKAGQNICTITIPVYEECIFKPKSQNSKFLKSVIKGSNYQQNFVPNLNLDKKDNQATQKYILNSNINSNILNSNQQSSKKKLNQQSNSKNDIIVDQTNNNLQSSQKKQNMPEQTKAQGKNPKQEDKNLPENQNNLILGYEKNIYNIQDFDVLNNNSQTSISEDNKLQNSLNCIANQQLKALTKKDQKGSEVEENQVNSQQIDQQNDNNEVEGNKVQSNTKNNNIIYSNNVGQLKYLSYNVNSHKKNKLNINSNNMAKNGKISQMNNFMISKSAKTATNKQQYLQMPYIQSNQIKNYLNLNINRQFDEDFTKQKQKLSQKSAGRPQTAPIKQNSQQKNLQNHNQNRVQKFKDSQGQHKQRQFSANGRQIQSTTNEEKLMQQRSQSPGNQTPNQNQLINMIQVTKLGVSNRNEQQN